MTNKEVMIPETTQSVRTWGITGTLAPPPSWQTKIWWPQKSQARPNWAQVPEAPSLSHPSSPKSWSHQYWTPETHSLVLKITKEKDRTNIRLHLAHWHRDRRVWVGFRWRKRMAVPSHIIRGALSRPVGRRSAHWLNRLGLTRERKQRHQG